MAAASCFGLKEEEYKTLTPIEFYEVNPVINVSLGQTLIYDKPLVISELPVEYQWSYGKEKLEVISTDQQINYLFNKLGTYTLRLRVDNGESIAYKYFTLNVNSGLDEGLLVLANDDETGAASLTFIKKRTQEEIEENGQEIWPDVFKTMNPGKEINNGTSLFLSAFMSGGISYNHLTIATADEHGTIYDIEPKTMTLITTVPMKDQFGAWCCDFAGSQTAATGAYTFMRGSDGHVYRWDLFTPFITERTDVASAAGSVYGSKSLIYNSNIRSVFFNDELICQPSSSATTTVQRIPAGYEMVNLCSDRDANRTYVLLHKVGTQDYSIVYTTGSLASFKDVSTFTAASVSMDRSSIFCSSLNSNDVYYSYEDKIWRWGLSTAPSERPAFTLPAGEKICDIATNFMGDKANGTEETLLYVATFNESKGTGSVFVFDFATESLVASYAGICTRPVKILYKYRIS